MNSDFATTCVPVTENLAILGLKLPLWHVIMQKGGRILPTAQHIRKNLRPTGVIVLLGTSLIWAGFGLYDW